MKRNSLTKNATFEFLEYHQDYVDISGYLSISTHNFLINITCIMLLQHDIYKRIWLKSVILK